MNSTGVLARLAPTLRAHGALVDLIGSPNATVAVPAAAQPFVLGGLTQISSRAPIVVVTATSTDAERLGHDLAHYLDAPSGSVVVLPAWETLPFERVSPELGTMGHRLSVLWSMGRRGGPRVVVASARAVLQRLSTGTDRRPFVVEAGSELNVDEAVERLVAMGYRREHQVEHRGEIAVRGGIIDVFASTEVAPWRIDLFGDQVERLTMFDVADQRSVADLDAVEVFGCREMVLSPVQRERATELITTEPWGQAQWRRLADGEAFDGMESFLPWLEPELSLLTDHLGPEAQVVLIEPRRIRDRANELLEEEQALAGSLSQTWGRGSDEPIPYLHADVDRLLSTCRSPVLSVLGTPDHPDMPSISVRGFDHVAGDAKRLVTQLTGLIDRGTSITLCPTTAIGAKRLQEVLGAESIDALITSAAEPTPGVRIVSAPITSGFYIEDLKIAVWSESDITGRRIAHRRPRPRARATDGFFDDLAPGGYVVHRHHGVARYAGTTTRTIGGATRDYLILEYRGQDRLYLPIDQIGAITPYSGGDAPNLSRMGGADWTRTRARARAAASEVAVELVELYRQRLAVRGYAFGPDTPWQRELESSFPFTETHDQLRAIADVKADMETDRPMDRLVCGDVGFGKTEVALRAVFKAVQAGKQAAVLVPTTLLASQHFQTFTDRLSPFGVKVELLSRFLAAPEVRKVTAGLTAGTVDVVVATHRLLTQDVVFKDLGLLVVDEEQRFGVSHKEAVKRMTTGIDVLTLTASPIPRTLEMALTGIRDLSMVNTPPSDRQSILTFVGEYDEAAVSEAIRRELLREGQVFFVHNRVADIDIVANRLRDLVPEARVAIAHGQMDEGSLETVVLDFWDGQYDVLVCTTIVESGIDMPSVNTLVVDRADLLGLGQLHQLRGRVGRSNQRAYAYLFHPADRVLSEQAYERLKTIGEHTELGSGFKIAMRDLEIRGAGNLLGSDQSGHIAAVGYDLYVQLVAEAVAEARGETKVETPVIAIDVPGAASLPADYVTADDMRIEAYRRLAQVTDLEQVADIENEWLDRFGPLPPAASGLLAVARLRTSCLRLGINEVAVMAARAGGPRQSIAKLSPITLPASAQIRLQRTVPGSSYREDLRQVMVPVAPKLNAADYLRQLLDELVPVPATVPTTMPAS